MEQPRLELTPRGRVTLLLVHLTASAAYITGDFAPKIATAALAAPFLVDWIYKLVARPRIEARVGKRRTRAGDLFLEPVRIRNHAQAAHALEFCEPTTSVRKGGAYLEALPAGAEITANLPARARRRGITDVRVFEVVTTHPFGMLRRRLFVRCEAEFIAEPARTELGDEVLEQLRSDDREPIDQGYVTGNEFFALREYHPGEDARHVHAQRSASLGTLVLRDLRGGDNPETLIVVDLRRAPGRGYRFSDPRLEPRLSLAATLLDELLERHSRVRCRIIDDSMRSWTIDAQIDADSFLEALATAQAVPFRPLTGEWFDSIDERATAFWVQAGGYDAKSDRARFPDIVVVHEEES
ncbi:MAG: DUF58 domain-containing protein [Planctomycetes bacterium]|nr:DUF58 domain-containing protein [Planctomycetota bacterium]